MESETKEETTPDLCSCGKVAQFCSRHPSQTPDYAALVAEARKAESKAIEKLSALCHGKETFTMRIPADRGYDHDLIFAEAFGFIDRLAAAITDLAEKHATLKEGFLILEDQEKHNRECLEAVEKERDTLAAQLQQERERGEEECSRLHSAYRAASVEFFAAVRRLLRLDEKESLQGACERIMADLDAFRRADALALVAADPALRAELESCEDWEDVKP